MRERLKTDKKLFRNLILIGAAVFCLLAASCYTLFIKPNLKKETYVYKEETVKRGDLILGIMESGSVELGETSVMYDLDLSTEDEEEDEDSSDSGDEEDEEAIRYLEIEEAYVVSGQRITEGEALFKLTDKSSEAVRRKLNAAQAKKQITLSEAQTEYHITLLSADSAYDSSVVAGNRAGADYQAALSQSAESVTILEADIQVLQQEIEEAEKMLADEELLESYQDAKLTCTQKKNIFEDTDVHNAAAYISNLSDYQEAESALKQLEEELQGYRDQIADNQSEIEKKQSQMETARGNQALANQEAENNYESARLEGELAEDIYHYTVDSLEDSVAQAQTDLDEITDKLEAFESFVGNDNIIYADSDGLVSAVNYSKGDDLVNTGAMLTYVKEDEYTVSIDVSEEDVAALAIGDKVDLVFTAYPDSPGEGTIISITTSATSEHVSTVSYPVTIRIEGDTGLLYGGMTADVTFVTESAEDVLYVSKKAVFEENGISYVYRQTETGGREKTEVETGFSDAASIEIKRGLSEGDTIYIQSVMNISEESGSDEEEAGNGSIAPDSGEAGSGGAPGSPGSGQEFGGQLPENLGPEGGMPDMAPENRGGNQ